MDLERLSIGIIGAIVGVVGWLFVGLYIDRRSRQTAARNAARVVYFELVGNHLTIFTALEYGAFGPLARASFDRLLPELATWLSIEDLQAVALAYLGHGGYEQVTSDPTLPPEVRRHALLGLHEAHRVAVRVLRARAFDRHEIERLAAFASPDQMRLLEAADASPARPARSPEASRAGS
ncbi:MAG: hypothetical protein ACJ761_08050 [Chloroflexota bacterium]